MRRAPSVHEFEQDHTTGNLLGRIESDLGPGRWKRLAQIIIGGGVIAILGLMVINGYYKARKPALLADCMGRVRMLGQAVQMYSNDNDFRAPLAANWRYGLSSYCDVVGGMDEAVTEVRTTTKARGFSSPMRCLGNQTVTPISYFYLNGAELWGRMDTQTLGTHPVLVDEVHHAKVVILRDDTSAHTIEPEEWVNLRQNELHIARRRDWRSTFAYYVLPESLP
ncbi:MAG TPA: hypothetical protein QGH10_21210 [Armatimonadota bacterium]|nr:hypothetical protein [Armatimonadota bacterium]